jgi:hypothetical protein
MDTMYGTVQGILSFGFLSAKGWPWHRVFIEFYVGVRNMPLNILPQTLMQMAVLLQDWTQVMSALSNDWFAAGLYRLICFGPVCAGLSLVLVFSELYGSSVDWFVCCLQPTNVFITRLVNVLINVLRYTYCSEIAFNFLDFVSWIIHGNYGTFASCLIPTNVYHFAPISQREIKKIRIKILVKKKKGTFDTSWWFRPFHSTIHSIRLVTPDIS